MTNANENTAVSAEKTETDMLDNIVRRLASQLDEVRHHIANQISAKEIEIIKNLSPLEKKLFVELHLSTVENDPYIQPLLEDPYAAEKISEDPEDFYKFHAAVNYRIALDYEITTAEKAAKK